LRSKQRYLLELIRPMRQVSFRYHDVEVSLLEAALARGDRRLGEVLYKAWQSGCHADGWTEHFQPGLWRAAFAASGLTQEEYACRAYDKDDHLPWQHIESGVSRKWLWREYEQSAAQGITEDCRHGVCTGCGVCGALDSRPQIHNPAAAAVGDPPPATCAEEGGAHPSPAAQERQRWRLRLAVEGPARWLSQLDILAAFEKSLRRAALPMAFSQGFNPHMLISWGPAHAVGLSGESEYTDLTFANPPPGGWTERLNALLSPGLRLLAAVPIADNTPALMSAIDRADYTLELLGEIDGPALEKAIGSLLACQSYIVERSSPKGNKRVDIRPALRSLSCEDNTLVFSCRLNAGAVVKPPELIHALAPGARAGAYCRTAMYIAGREPLCCADLVLSAEFGV
jgi:radical SAM-linked protein